MLHNLHLTRFKWLQKVFIQSSKLRTMSLLTVEQIIVNDRSKCLNFFWRSDCLRGWNWRLIFYYIVRWKPTCFSRLFSCSFPPETQCFDLNLDVTWSSNCSLPSTVIAICQHDEVAFLKAKLVVVGAFEGKFRLDYCIFHDCLLRWTKVSSRVCNRNNACNSMQGKLFQALQVRRRLRKNWHTIKLSFV